MLTTTVDSRTLKKFVRYIAHSSLNSAGFSYYPGGTIILLNDRGIRCGRRDFQSLKEEEIMQAFSSLLLDGHDAHEHLFHPRKAFLAEYISQIIDEGHDVSYLRLDLLGCKLNLINHNEDELFEYPLMIDAYDFEHLYLRNGYLKLPRRDSHFLIREIE